ncbi:hypothetical protein AAVH_02616 [Aphelenchoides avenae]|nr:hypothetical protein AAVH_02616 [Aphelenchus avenae]
MQLPLANQFLDVYVRIHPVDDFCGAQKCNITYAISVLVAQNQFDLQSVMLQDGMVARNPRLFFEENTVIRLTKDLRSTASSGKVYLGLMLFDVPEDIQNYVVVDVTDVIHADRRAKVEFASETVRIGVHVYKRSESMLFTEMVEKMEAVGSELEAIGLKESKEESTGLGSPARGCTCTQARCNCCRHVAVRKVHLDHNVCMNVSYVSKESGVTLALNVDNHVYYSKGVSLTNPQANCYEVPHLREYASLCLKPYNMKLEDDALTGCVEVESKLYHVKVGRVKLGCFRLQL